MVPSLAEKRPGEEKWVDWEKPENGCGTGFPGFCGSMMNAPIFFGNTKPCQCRVVESGSRAGRPLRLAIYRQLGCSFCRVPLKRACVGSCQCHPNSMPFSQQLRPGIH